MRPKIKKILTEQEYLSIERAAETKSEFYEGEMFGLAGTTAIHNKIVNNIVMRVGPKLKDKPCSFYTLDVRVKISKSGLYTYPDFVIACGEKQFIDDQNDTLLNPTLIIEVLSPSTEQYDRTTKFNHYRKIESFKEYLLIAQDKIAIEQFIKNKNDEWIYKEYTVHNKSVSLNSQTIKLQMEHIYDGVTFGKRSHSLR